ncbi:MAG TPA: hypothetical protein VNA66_01115, partial [Gammaproteobacteria bacterium]|nr:hypothetical protein [Gammaproteobacteria bacterium]
MTRVLVALVLGVLLGATAAWLLRPPPLTLADLGDLQPPVMATAPAADAVVTAAAREGGADFYRQLADANTSELASMIRQAAAEPSSTERELALAVLLKRHSELDALGAVRLAREAGVGGLALSAVYGAWARKAPAQALAALSTVENPDAAAAVAVALIGALGNDAAAFDRVADVLAARDGEEAFSTVNAAPGPLTPAGAAVAIVAPRSALGLTAQKWADLDPRRALAVAQDVDDERLRLALESTALRSLARIAPDEAFARLSASGTESHQVLLLGGVFAELARTDPERALAAASDLPQELRRVALQQALPQLAERDPLAAARYLENLPLGPERQVFIQTIARSYGKRDAVAALAWARSMPERDNLVGAVLSGVAEQDPQRALDLALELTVPRERMQAIQFVAMTGARNDAAAEAFANRLLANDDRQLRESAGMMLVSTWASRSPEGAMRWLLANGQNMPPNLFMQVGQQLAMRDPRTALAQSAQIPAAAREQWLQGVAQGYAQNDPRAAVDWLAQFRGEAWHGRAVTTVAMTLADRDGAAAARLIDELSSGGLPPQLASTVAMNWANRDPAAAAAWALERRSEQERATAVRSVVTVWSNQDAAAARQWMLRLPQGPMRDGALTTVLATTAMQKPGALDTALLNAFTSDAARQQAVLQVVQSLAC